AGPEHWRLLIYTVPSEPSRKRAFVWRELKKAGAVYLRDGVCALPELDDAAAALDRIAAKVEEFEGEATVIARAALDARRAQALADAARRDRQQEYAELSREGENLHRHVERETRHREFTFAELEELGADLGKLRAWFRQIQSRDYFGCPEASEAAAVVERCTEALGAFVEAASEQAAGG
ncbi:MAG: hypothetical protein KGJ86_15810, partial [Chloroflexota bacterium]|nr:hypothetical protein [Chloroflexota bacterium]